MEKSMKANHRAMDTMKNDRYTLCPQVARNSEQEGTHELISYRGYKNKESRENIIFLISISSNLKEKYLDRNFLDRKCSILYSRNQ